MFSLGSFSFNRYGFFIFLSCLIFSAPDVHSANLEHQHQYSACMSLVETDPEGAFDSALSWQGLGGDEAAEHCIASALIKMGQYESAAKRLEELAQNTMRPKEFKAQILSQAALAWSLEKELAQARAVISTAIELDETNPVYYVERAQILAEANHLNEVIPDLDQAIMLNSNYSDAFALRGSAYRLLEKFMDAEDDINHALKLNPNHPEALLERGMLYRIEGNNDLARQYWLKVLSLEEKGPLADVARRNLEKMDVQPDSP